MEKLFDFLKQYGGKIISTNDMTSSDISEANSAGRMFVDNDGFGFVWEPKITKFPETIEEVEFYERWYPSKPTQFGTN